MLLTKPRVENTNRIFAILDPSIFPTDKLEELLNTASIETKSSGIDVPNPIITSPTKKSDTFSFSPKPTEDEIRMSALFIARNRPNNSLIISRNI
tara:strand:- start:410 stop:694 length:285 start_codon:yes stop_codon:yes gene_type:complete